MPQIRSSIIVKRMGVDDSVLSEVVRRVLSVAKPEKIILVGSVATGQMTTDSDIDFS